MTGRARCPRHPSESLDACGFCEAKIARQELAEADEYPDEADRDADRYEAWLDRIGEP